MKGQIIKTNRSKIIFATFSSFFAALFVANAASAASVSTFAELSSCISGSDAECSIAADFDLTGKININRNVTINGNGHTLSRDGVYAGNLFSIAAGAEVEISNLKFDGKAPGWNADLDPEHTLFRTNADKDRAYGNYNVTKEDDDATATASAILNKGKLTISNSEVKDIYCSSNGGFVTVQEGELIIDSSTFNHNSATYGGVAHVSGTTSKVSITNSSFDGNNAGSLGEAYAGAGGVLYTSHIDSVTIEDSTFTHSSAKGNGGVFFIDTADVIFKNNLFDNNLCGNDGSVVKFSSSFSATTPPLPNGYEHTVLSQNNVYSNNVSTGYYWHDGDSFPDSDVPANGNSEGAFSYYSRGFSEFSIDGDVYKDNVADMGSGVDLYACGESDPDDDCIPPAYNIKNTTFDNSYLQSGRKGDLNISNTSFINNDDLFLTIKLEEGSITMSDIVIKDNPVERRTGSINGITADSISISNIEVTNTERAIRFTSAQTTVNNANIHDNTFSSYAFDFVPDGTRPSTATLSNSTVTNNTGTMGIITTAGSTSTAPFTFNIAGDTTITNNQVNYSPNYPDKSGYGGGICVRYRPQNGMTINIDDSANLSGNTAEIAGNDIYVYPSDNENATATINANARFFYDNSDNRVNENSDQTMLTIVIPANQTLGLSARNGTEDDPQPEPEPTPTPTPTPTPDPEPIPPVPNTGDNIINFAALFCASAIFGTAAIILLTKKR